jgi:hypothetical protein
MVSVSIVFVEFRNINNRKSAQNLLDLYDYSHRKKSITKEITDRTIVDSNGIDMSLVPVLNKLLQQIIVEPITNELFVSVLYY